MTRPYVPQAVLDAAHARSAARAARDWAEADRLLALIAKAGWRVVDRGTDFSLEPEAPADIVEGDTIRYGRSGSVPSRAAEPSSARATLVLVSSPDAAPIGPALAGILSHRSDRDQVIVIEDGPDAAVGFDPGTGAGLDEVLRTATRLGAGATLNIALRRAKGAIVVVLDGAWIPDGDIVPPLATAMMDGSIAVAGLIGRRTTDLRHFDDVTTDADATTIAAGVLAFRRADALAAGPADESMVDGAYLDAWWSLVLREGRQVGATPRRARVVPEVPVHRLRSVAGPSTDDPVRARRAKRNFYRILDRFRGRTDLLEPATRG